MRALGVYWCIESDRFGFRIVFEDKPLTRRGMLSTVSSIYDVKGFAGPFLLRGKKILQEVTAEKKDWDAKVSDYHVKQWNAWKSDTLLLQDVYVPRCYIPDGFGEPSSHTLHCFSDAYSVGYGQVSYRRCVNIEGKMHVSLVMTKARIAPMKPVTIPRLEHTAAVVSAKVAALLKEELDISNLQCVFWTDSQIVLGYIMNECKRFRIDVANRVKTVRDYSNKDQWKYVGTEENPADYASRGLSMKCREKAKIWFNGPEFLWKGGDDWLKQPDSLRVADDDEEVKPVTKVNKITIKEDVQVLLHLETRMSSWYRLVRVFARVKKFIAVLRFKVQSV